MGQTSSDGSGDKVVFSAMARSRRWRLQSSGCAADHSIGGDDRKTEPACGGQHRVALLPGPELGVEILAAR